MHSLERGRGYEECKGKYYVPSQSKAKAKKIHKIIDERLLINIV